MNILSALYYYAFPNSSDDYIILEYDKKYNEIIEYVEYSDKVYNPSKFEIIKATTYYLTYDLYTKSKIAINAISIKTVDMLAEIYYRNYNNIHNLNFNYKLNDSMRMLPPLKKKYIPRISAEQDVNGFISSLENELRKDSEYHFQPIDVDDSPPPPQQQQPPLQQLHLQRAPHYQKPNNNNDILYNDSDNDNVGELMRNRFLEID